MQERRTYLDLLQVLEDFDNVLANHERVIRVFGVKIILVVTIWVSLCLLNRKGFLFQLLNLNLMSFGRL